MIEELERQLAEMTRWYEVAVKNDDEAWAASAGARCVALRVQLEKARTAADLTEYRAGVAHV